MQRLSFIQPIRMVPDAPYFEKTTSAPLIRFPCLEHCFEETIKNLQFRFPRVPNLVESVAQFFYHAVHDW